MNRRGCLALRAALHCGETAIGSMYARVEKKGSEGLSKNFYIRLLSEKSLVRNLMLRWLA